MTWNSFYFDEVQNIFPKTVPTGIKHGTVTVIIDKTPIEVTTFRTEGDYTDNRRPDSVKFVSDIKYDLSRRDFTVNAMAYNPRVGIVDIFGGCEDLKAKILRAVGEPEKRFSEDALRILRLFRFASTLNYSIDENTLISAENSAPLVKNISRERIFAELLKAVCGTNTGILNKLLETDALNFLNLSSFNDLSILNKLPLKEELRLFAFLKLCQCDILATLKELRASNAQKKYCERLNSLTKSPLPQSKAEIKKRLYSTGNEEFYDYLEFISVTENEDVIKPKKLFDEIIKSKEPYLLEHLAINGTDLKSFGFTGEEIRELLFKALGYVTENPDKNQKEILIEYLM